MKKLLWFGILLLSGCGSGTTWTSLRENREGIRALATKSPETASDHFMQGLGSSPFQPQLHLNLGLALLELKKPDQAMQAFIAAERYADSAEQKFIARFNLGVVLGAAKKIDEALLWYQKALEIKPDSLDVKTNIELLMAQQSGQGQGEGEQQNQDSQDGSSKDQKDQKDKKDPKDQKQDQKDQKDPKDSKDPKDDKDKDGDKKDQKPKQFGNSPKYKPRPFEGELSESEVKKILGEIKQQEQRIRTEYNRKDVKERPRDKDW